MVAKKFKQTAGNLWRSFMDGLVQDAPVNEDDKTYGAFAHFVARQTSIHPSACLALYAEIANHIPTDESLRGICERIEQRSSALSDDAIMSITQRHGLVFQSPEAVKENVQAIMDKLPEHLQVFNSFDINKTENPQAKAIDELLEMRASDDYDPDDHSPS